MTSANLREPSTMHPEYPVGLADEIRVLVANVYVGNRRVRDDLELFQEIGPDVVGVSEGHRLPRTLPYGFRRWQTGKGGKWSREVPVLVRRSKAIDVQAQRYVKGAEGVRDYARKGHRWTRVGKPRWITVVRLEKDGRPVSIINTHMHAAIVGKKGQPLLGSRRVRQYRTHMKRLLQVVREERAAGFEPIVTGDLNYPPRGDRWRWAPDVALKRVGLEYVQHRVDGFAADPEVFEISHDLIEPKGSDHDKYVLARLRWRA